MPSITIGPFPPMNLSVPTDLTVQPLPFSPERYDSAFKLALQLPALHAQGPSLAKSFLRAAPVLARGIDGSDNLLAEADLQFKAATIYQERSGTTNRSRQLYNNAAAVYLAAIAQVESELIGPLYRHALLAYQRAGNLQGQEQVLEVYLASDQYEELEKRIPTDMSFNSFWMKLLMTGEPSETMTRAKALILADASGALLTCFLPTDVDRDLVNKANSYLTRIMRAQFYQHEGRWAEAGALYTQLAQNFERERPQQHKLIADYYFAAAMCFQKVTGYVDQVRDYHQRAGAIYGRLYQKTYSGRLPILERWIVSLRHSDQPVELFKALLLYANHTAVTAIERVQGFVDAAYMGIAQGILPARELAGLLGKARDVLVPIARVTTPSHDVEGNRAALQANLRLMAMTAVLGDTSGARMYGQIARDLAAGILHHVRGNDIMTGQWDLVRIILLFNDLQTTRTELSRVLLAARGVVPKEQLYRDILLHLEEGVASAYFRLRHDVGNLLVKAGQQDQASDMTIQGLMEQVRYFRHRVQLIVDYNRRYTTVPALLEQGRVFIVQALQAAEQLRGTVTLPVASGPSDLQTLARALCPNDYLTAHRIITQLALELGQPLEAIHDAIQYPASNFVLYQQVEQALGDHAIVERLAQVHPDIFLARQQRDLDLLSRHRR